MHRFVCATLLPLLLFTPAPTRADNPGQPWVEATTAHFTVLTNGSEKDARRVAAQFERMRAVFHQIMPSAADDPAAPIRVLALKNRNSFRALEPAAYLAKKQLDLAGLFVRADDHNYVLLRLDAEGDHPFSTVYHEYTHYILRKADAWLPLWANEGLAEFYQNTSLATKDVRVGQPSADDILYLRQTRLLPLATLLAVDHNSPYYHDEQKGSVFYAQSWALTHYLISNDGAHKTHLLAEYLALVQNHTDPVTAAEKAFGDLHALERALDSYIRQSAFQEFGLPGPVVFDENSFRIRSVPAAEVDSVRADVLLDVGRTAESEALLATVLAADPQNAGAHETMGMLKFRQNDILAAKKWFGEAVALDSQSYLANYYFGVLSLESGERDHDADIEKSLRAATKLNPRFAPAFDSLAQFLASRHKDLAEAHLLNATSISLEPESLPYRLNGAEILAEANRYDDALRVLKAARPLAKTLDDTDQLSRRMDVMEKRQAYFKQVSAGSASAEQTATQPAPSAPSPASAQRAGTAVLPSGRVTTASIAGGAAVLTSDQAAQPASLLQLPSGAPVGPHHTVSGVMHNVQCSYPTTLMLTLNSPGKAVRLYSTNYFKIIFTTANYDPPAEIDPCKNIEGMKARIEFGEVASPDVAGQILSVELSR